MIKAFFGDDRVRALAEIENFLGKDHETIDGLTLSVEDLPSVFFGATFFEEKRRILINDLTKNTAVFTKLPELLESPHRVALLDFAIDKRTAVYKELKNKIEFLEYNLEKPPVFRIAYQIYDQAEKNLPRALELLEPLKTNENPIAFTGLLISKALKNYDTNPNVRNREILKALAKTDLAIKNTNHDLWLLVETFLAELARKSI